VHSHQSIAKSKPSLLASAVNSSLSQYSLWWQGKLLLNTCAI
jgi:hypothetical protein